MDEEEATIQYGTITLSSSPSTITSMSSSSPGPSSSVHHNSEDEDTIICLFGLSADPPTNMGGHLGMLQALLEQTSMTIYMLPVYQHTFEEKRTRMVDFEHRLQMCQRAVQQQPSFIIEQHQYSQRVVVSDAERLAFEWAMANQRESYSSPPSSDDDTTTTSPSSSPLLSFGTANLLAYLHETATIPNTKFVLALGADAFIDCLQGKWKESDRVLQQVHGFLVFARQPTATTKTMLTTMAKDGEGEKMSQEETTLSSISAVSSSSSHHYYDDTILQDCLQRANTHTAGNTRLLSVNHLQAISSSQVRDSTDLNVWKQVVPQSVLDYVLEHELYAIGKVAAQVEPLQAVSNT